ncbi:MAG TPA: nucleotide exchange factor GrpE [Anaerolineales bacterium]
MSTNKKRASEPASWEENPQGEVPPGDDNQSGEGGQGQENLNEEGMALEEPEITIADYQELQDELEKARMQSAENFEGWQRERADFLNYKRRTERDLSQTAQNLKGNIIKQYLVILDDLDRALKNRPQGSEDVTAWENGIELIYRKLQNILAAEGVQQVAAEEGQAFDPNVMEAISHEQNPDYESGQVIEVVSQGYIIGDRVLRPALVRVAQ